MAKNHIIMVRTLIEHSEENLSIRTASRYAKKDYKSAYLAVKDLEKEGLVTSELFGKARKISLNRKVHPFIFEAEFERLKSLKNKNVLAIRNRLSELNFPFVALLFGSHAKGKARKGSDIDLLIVSEETRESRIREVLDLFPLKIHATFADFSGFAGMLRSKEFSVVSEAVKSNFVLVGTEDYYRMLENA